MKTFEELRNIHKSFNYNSYNIIKNEKTIEINYQYSIDDLDSFTTTWTFPYSVSYDEEILDRLVFSLGLTEAISYYKITCSKYVNIKCGYMSKDKEGFWKKLFYNGLGEFMYINNIEVSKDDLFSFVYIDNKNPFEKVSL